MPGQGAPEPCSVQPHSCPHSHCVLWGCGDTEARGLQVAQVPLSTSLELGAGADTPPLSICRERNSSPSSTTGTRPDLSRHRIWPQMWPTCSGSKQPRQQLLSQWNWEEPGCGLPSPQRAWTGAAPVSGGTGRGSTVPPTLSQAQQLWSFGAQGKVKPCAAQPNSICLGPAQPSTEGSNRRGTGDWVAQHEVGKEV